MQFPEGLEDSPLKNSKALSKQEMSNVCKDACYFSPFFEFESAACFEKRIQKTIIPTNV